MITKFEVKISHSRKLTKAQKVEIIEAIAILIDDNALYTITPKITGHYVEESYESHRRE